MIHLKKYFGTENIVSLWNYNFPGKINEKGETAKECV